MTIRPIAGKVLLRIIPAQENNVGGIIVGAVDEEARRATFREALVEALPNGYKGDLCVGDKVVLPPYTGAEVKVDKVMYVFIKPDILDAVME